MEERGFCLLVIDLSILFIYFFFVSVVAVRRYLSKNEMKSKYSTAHRIHTYIYVSMPV